MICRTPPVGGRQTSVIRGEEQLANLFVRGHLAQRGFDPSGRGGRQFVDPLFAGATPAFAAVFFADVVPPWLRAL